MSKGNTLIRKYLQYINLLVRQSCIKESPVVIPCSELTSQLRIDALALKLKFALMPP